MLQSKLTAPILWDEMFKLWGVDHTVERLLLAAGKCRNNESHWLELKSIPTLKKKDIRKYESGNKPWSNQYVNVPDDYTLENLVQPLCALLNNSLGGFLIVGIEDDGATAPFDKLFVNSNLIPMFDGESFVDVDKWSNWIRTLLKENQWHDRYNSCWKCSINLASSERVKMNYAFYKSHPVLVFIAYPSEEPVCLIQECCPAKCCHEHLLDAAKALNSYSVDQKMKDGVESRFWCGYPHEYPLNIPAINCFHVCKRIKSDTTATTGEWDIQELVKFWNSRTADGTAFKRIIDEEKRTFDDFYGVNAFPCLATIHKRTLIRIGERLGSAAIDILARSKLPLDSGFQNSLTVIHNDCQNETDVARLLEKTAEHLIVHDVTQPCPVLIEFDRLSIYYRKILHDNSTSFVIDYLADEYDRREISSKMWEPLLRKRSVYVVAVFPNRDDGISESMMEECETALYYFLQDYNVGVVTNRELSFNLT